MFAAAAPVCWTIDSAKADRIARVTIRIFHGVKEPFVLVRNSRYMYEALKKVGFWKREFELVEGVPPTAVSSMERS